MSETTLQIIEGPGAGRELGLAGASVIGRDPGSAAVVVDDPEVSRRHASLIPEGQSVNVEDLGSTNGTFVNGERLVGARVLVPGDRLRVGTTVLELTLANGAAAAAAADDGMEPAHGGEPFAEPSALAGVGGGSPEQPPGAPGGPPPPPPPGGAGAPPPPPPPGGAPPTEAPPTQAPPGAPPSYPPVAYGGGSDYPVDFQAEYPEGGIARWRALFQGFLLIPHWFVLLFVLIAAYFALIGAFFAILFTGKYPRGIFNFLAGSVHWTNRVTGYQYWMTERYPPFSLDPAPDYPVRTRIDYPEEGIARWRVLVHWLLAIPHFIVISFLFLAEYVVIVITFFSILFTRKWPRSMFDFTVGIIRWRTRANAYGYLWMTEQYPPFSLE